MNFSDAIWALPIEDEEVKDALGLVAEAVELGAVDVEQALESLESLRGEADNGMSFDEYGTGADFDHVQENGHYDFSRVCIFFLQKKAYCSRQKMLEAIEVLKEKL